MVFMEENRLMFSRENKFFLIEVKKIQIDLKKLEDLSVITLNIVMITQNMQGLIH